MNQQSLIRASFLAGVCLALSEATPSSAAASHPFILRSKAEASAIKRRIEIEPWAGNGESFTFKNCAWLRVEEKKVNAFGELRSLRLRVEGNPRLSLNGTPRRATVTDGILVAEGLHESKRPDLESWLRRGELGSSPKAVTAAYPLSDQANKGGWKKYEIMTDEFAGSKLDQKRWWPTNPRWLGRKPALFHAGNVQVAGGKLQLAMRKQELPAMKKQKGYHTYTSAAVQSKTRVLYGYFEVKCKPMASAGSSSFWFYHNEKNLWTEIDVFEIGGKAPGFEKKYNMNVHVFKTPAEKRHWSSHGVWSAPKDLADDYHVYGLEWDKEKIKWYFDGVLVRWVENTHWHQPLTLNFDSETMPDWFGLPKDEDLPSVYSIEYVRAWKETTGR